MIVGADVNGQIQPVKPDDILLNTLRQDEAASHDEALLRIYRRLRPGNPTDEAKVREFFQDRFLNESRYNLGSVGRFRINRKLKSEGESRVLTTEDYVKTLIADSSSKGADVYLPEGDQVLGQREILKETAKELRRNNVAYATPEFAKISGDARLSELMLSTPFNFQPPTLN